MSDNNPSLNPPQPTIDPSEPEREQRLIESATDSTRKNERIVIGLPAVTAYLSKHDMKLNDNGFIVGENSEEPVEPAVYNSDVFFNAPQPNDYSISEYFVKSSEDNSASKQKTHLSELHAITLTGGRFRPVIDDTLRLSKLHREVGAMLTTVTAWSDGRDLTEPKHDIPDVTVNAVISHEPTLTCLKCDYGGTHSQWNGDTNDPVCPDCGLNWQVKSVNKCRKCSNEYAFEELADTDTGIITSPKCPHCIDNDQNSNVTPDFETKTRYDKY